MPDYHPEDRYGDRPEDRDSDRHSDRHSDPYEAPESQYGGPKYQNSHEQSPAFQRLESMVRAASEYVQPTNDLRPSLLEAARDACQQKRARRYLGSLAVLILLVAVTRFPVVLFSPDPGLIAMQSAELQLRAARSVVENGAEPNWALVEAYRALRSEHAARLRQSN